MKNKKLTKEHIEELITKANNKFLDSILQEKNESITINWECFEFKKQTYSESFTKIILIKLGEC